MLLLKIKFPCTPHELGLQLTLSNDVMASRDAITDCPHVQVCAESQDLVVSPREESTSSPA